MTNLQKDILEKIKLDIITQKKMSIKECSERNYVSPSFLVKLSKKLGYSGYSELIFALKSSDVNVAKKSNCICPLDIIGNYSERLVNDFVDLLLLGKDGVIEGQGKGYSAHVVKYISYRLSEAGFRFLYFGDYREVHKCNYILLAVSESGENNDLVDNVEREKRNGHKSIAFTRNVNSRLAKVSDLVIVVNKSSEENKLNFKGFCGCSILAFEVLFCEVLKKM